MHYDCRLNIALGEMATVHYLLNSFPYLPLLSALFSRARLLKISPVPLLRQMEVSRRSRGLSKSPAIGAAVVLAGSVFLR